MRDLNKSKYVKQLNVGLNYFTKLQKCSSRALKFDQKFGLRSPYRFGRLVLSFLRLLLNNKARERLGSVKNAKALYCIKQENIR